MLTARQRYEEVMKKIEGEWEYLHGRWCNENIYTLKKKWRPSISIKSRKKCYEFRMGYSSRDDFFEGKDGWNVPRSQWGELVKIVEENGKEWGGKGER